jgi:hypothetical protein
MAEETTEMVKGRNTARLKNYNWVGSFLYKGTTHKILGFSTKLVVAYEAVVSDFLI